MRFKRVLLSYLYFIFFIMTLILVSNIKVFGEEQSFSCTVTGHYKNPLTNKVEDSGGESAMATGQGMVNGVVNKKGALTINNGKYYLDFTLSLADFSSKHSFSDAGTGSEVACSLVGHGKDDNGQTNKYRAQLSSQSSVLRISMYVEPMGRNVIYFISIGDLKEKGGGKKADKKAEISTNNATESKGLNAPNIEQPAPNADSQQSNTAGVDSPDMQQQGAMNGGAGVNPYMQGAYPMPTAPYLPQGAYAPNPYAVNPYMPPNPYMPSNPYMPQNPYMVNPYMQQNQMQDALQGQNPIQAEAQVDAMSKPNEYGIEHRAYNAGSNMTAVDPGIEYNNSYEAGGDRIKGLILSTEKEVNDNPVIHTARPAIRFNNEIFKYIMPFIIAFALSFGVVLGLNYIKKKRV